MDSDNNIFTITPMTKRMEDLKPGETYTGSVTVINPVTASRDFHYSVRVAPYGVEGTNYAANLTADSNYTMITKWITVDNPTGVLKPNESKEVTYTIKVPSNAPAGGQYAAIIVSEDPEEAKSEDDGVAVKDSFEAASLIYADIDGETVHGGEVKDNSIPGFIASAPITLSATITNTGNVHEYATFVISATNFFTGEVIVDASDEKDYYTEMVMPETERLVQRDINENLPQLGIVHVEQTIYYNGQMTKEARDVIICPIWFLILAIVAIGMLIGVIVRMILKHRKKSSTAVA